MPSYTYVKGYIDIEIKFFMTIRHAHMHGFVILHASLVLARLLSLETLLGNL